MSFWYQEFFFINHPKFRKKSPLMLNFFDQLLLLDYFLQIRFMNRCCGHDL